MDSSNICAWCAHYDGDYCMKDVNNYDESLATELESLVTELCRRLEDDFCDSFEEAEV